MNPIPDLDDARTDPAEDRAEAELEAETALLRLQLGLACNAHHTRAVMAALSLTLQAIIVDVSRDLPAVEGFLELFSNALRHRWAHEQAAARDEAGEGRDEADEEAGEEKEPVN